MVPVNTALPNRPTGKETPAGRGIGAGMADSRDRFRGNGVASRAARSSYMRGSSAKQTEAQLADMYADQQENFDRYYAPLIDELEKEADSTDIVDRSVKDAAALEGRSRGQVERSMGRSGETLTTAQKRGLERTIDSNVSKGESVILNTGRTKQREYQEGVTSDLMGIGTALQNNSVGALSKIASNQQRREQEYEKAKSGLMSSIMGTVGAIGGTMIGGPAGGAVGAGIGSAIGGG